MTVLPPTCTPHKRADARAEEGTALGEAHAVTRVSHRSRDAIARPCAASKAITDILPGRVRARGDKHDMPRDDGYRENVYGYVRDRQGPKAAVWCLDGLRREALVE